MPGVDGPLKMLLWRFIDKPARFHLQRVKPDTRVTIALEPEEVAELRAALDEFDRQVALDPNSTGSSSMLDLTNLVRMRAA